MNQPAKERPRRGDTLCDEMVSRQPWWLPRNEDGEDLPREGSTWHVCGMARTRLSTTVNADLLEHARRVRSGVTDAALIAQP